MSRAARERGSALVISTMMVVVALGIVAALLATVGAQTSFTGGARDRTQALFVAEAGINDALYQVSKGTSAATMTKSFGGGSYTVTTTPSGTAYILHSNGTLNQQMRTVYAVIDRAAHILFPMAAVGTTHVMLRDSAFTDGFDSAVGPYNASANDNGHNHAPTSVPGSVQSAQDVQFYSNPFHANIYGNATPGNGFTPSVWAPSGGTWYVSGSSAPATFPAPATVAAPTIASSGTDLAVSAGTTTITGDKSYKSLTVSSTGKLVIQGPARVVVTGENGGAALLNTAELQIDATNGPVSLFVSNKKNTDVTSEYDYTQESFWADTNTAVTNVTGKASDFTVFIMDSSPATMQAGPGGGNPGNFYGSIYGPNANVRIGQGDGNQVNPINFYGAIVGAEVKIRGWQTGFHYDAVLGRSGTQVPGFYQVKVWKELPPGS